MGLSQAQLGPVDPVLTEHARRIAPVKFVADEVFPPLMVNEEKGQITVWDKTNLMVPDDAQRAIGAVAQEGQSPEPSYLSYSCGVHSKKDLLTQRELRIAGAQGLGAEQLRFNKTQKLVEQLMLLREKDLADKLNATANYETSYSTTLTTTWADTGGTPISDIETAIKQLSSGGIFPNAAIMDYDVWVTLARHSDMLDMLKYTNKGKMDESGFMSIFGLKPIVPKVRHNAAGTMTSTWGDSCIIAYIQGLGEVQDPNSPNTDATFGRTLLCEPFSVVEYEARDRDHRGASWIEVEIGFKHQFIGVDNVTDGDSIAGYLIDNAI